MNDDVRYALTENIAKNLVFIDGITRCGKSLFSSIISSFETMEHIQFVNLLEQLIPSVKLGGVDVNYAKSLLRLSLNELAYNLKLSRNVNFRKSDQTGIYNYQNPDKYINRLKLNDGEDIVDLIRKSDDHIPFQTHDLMVNLDVVEKLDIDYRMIELYRNPVDNLYSWWTRGWGERFGKDPRAFTLLISYNGEALPWYCSGYEDQVVNLNPYEKCCVIGMDLIKRSIDKHVHAKNPEKIMTVKFEEMIQRPEKQLERISSFIGEGRTQSTEKFLLEARCPRVVDPKDREDKLSVFKKNVNVKLYDELVDLSFRYENDTYGVPFGD